MTAIEQIPDWKLKRIRREHSGLGARIVKTGWWIFARREYEVACNCGWVDPRRIPVFPTEMGMVTAWLVRVACERHVIEIAMKKRRWWR
jgi:hypothetical protein